MSYPILLGRKLLKGRFIVDVSQKDLSSKQNAEKIRHKKNSDPKANPTLLIQ